MEKRKVINLKEDLVNNIKDKFNNCSDFVCQKIVLDNTNLNLYKMYINQFVDTAIVDEAVLKPIANSDIKSMEEMENIVSNGKIYHLDIKESEDVNEIVDNILDANFILICEHKAYIFDTKGYLKRSIDKPENETSVKGSKESFIESISANVSLVRRRIQSADLKAVEFNVGRETSTKINIMYMESIVDKKVLEEITERIKNISVPCIISVADFEEHIVDRKYSIFPQTITTERPDKVAGNIIEGKIAIFIDGFPVAYIVPAVFPMFMQTSEEYNNNYIVSSLIRVLRYISLLIALLLPAVYIAITTFHQEMLPTTLAESIIKSKENVPLPAFLEIIIMLVAFEILLEAGARMPKVAGQTVSIVGALIVGEAAVNAKFVSPAVVVIVAASAICGFVIPNQDMANTIRCLRFVLVIFASVAGFYAMTIATIVIVYYLCTLESFNTLYLKPFASNNGKNILQDTVFRQTINKSKNKMVRW